MTPADLTAPPRRGRRNLAACTLLLMLAGCAGAPDSGARPQQINISTRNGAEAARLISAWRGANGLPPVAWSEPLDAPAAEQARTVATRGALTHGDFAGRMARHGVGGAAAENLSAGSTNAAAVIERWKRSPGHNRNLLAPEMRRIGFARADSAGHGYGTYWALVLAQ